MISYCCYTKEYEVPVANYFSLLILTLCCANSNKESYRCPPEYTHYSDMDICLRLSEDTANWEGARLTCENNGETLLALDNLRLINWFKTLRTQNPYWAKNDIVWISGRKVQGEPWKWHGRSVNNIVLGDWDRFQPSGETISYPGACISVLGAPKYTWDDYGCYSLQRYVCEIPGKDYQLP
ncbi:hypothetical protein EB796_013142 [Bugula neritina]|uniref:C-type lectin domain-containing protein n=1 Tax=Bugula neritina TaxID=10212 RepID=A0A7J7JQB4_BUGNE|nr:hypothetical protein EB796_013142 [Bugula neritina]